MDISPKDTNLIILEVDEGLRIQTDTTEVFFNYDRIARRKNWEKTFPKDSLWLQKIYPSGGFFLDSDPIYQDGLQEHFMQLLEEGQLSFHVFWDEWLQKDYSQKKIWIESLEIESEELARASVEIFGLEVYQTADPNVLCAYVRFSPNVGHSSTRHFGVRLIRSSHLETGSMEIDCVQSLGFEL